MATERVVTLPWNEEGLIRSPGIHPLSLVARAMCLMKALNDIRPHGVSVDWGETTGVVAAMSKLVTEGHWEEDGLLPHEGAGRGFG